MIMIIFCWTPPPLFFENCDRLRFFEYLGNQLCLETNFGNVCYFLGEIYPKNAIDRCYQFQEIGERGNIYMVTYNENSMKLGLLN